MHVKNFLNNLLPLNGVTGGVEEAQGLVLHLLQ